MRVIFLNSWCAKIGKPYFDYIKSVSPEVDIYALTEITPELFFKLESTLPDFNGYFDEGIFDKNMNVVYGQAIFTKKNLETKPLDRIFTFRNTSTDVGYLSPYIVSVNNKSFYLGNIHGKAQPGTKLDTSARIRQSSNVISSAKDIDLPKIIGGDFNLNPDTKSVRMFEEAGYRNLIKEFDIKSTRNKISWEQFKDEPGFYKQHFADYCFVSKDVKVKSFEVPYNEVSDHLPLILDFEV